MSDFSKIKKV
jgi:hypothetical protein